MRPRCARGRARSSGPARADSPTLAKCQKVFAREGAKFAVRVIRSNLKCATRSPSARSSARSASSDLRPGRPSTPPIRRLPRQGADRLRCRGAQAGIVRGEQAGSGSSPSCIAAHSGRALRAQAGRGLSIATLNAGCSVLNPGYTCTLTNGRVRRGTPRAPAPRSDQPGQVGRGEGRRVSSAARRAIRSWRASRLARHGRRRLDAPSPAHDARRGNTTWPTRTFAMRTAAWRTCAASSCLAQSERCPSSARSASRAGLRGDSCTGGKYKLVLIAPGGTGLTKVATTWTRSEGRQPASSAFRYRVTTAAPPSRGCAGGRLRAGDLTLPPRARGAAS